MAVATEVVMVGGVATEEAKVAVAIRRYYIGIRILFAAPRRGVGGVAGPVASHSALSRHTRMEKAKSISYSISYILAQVNSTFFSLTSRENAVCGQE